MSEPTWFDWILAGIQSFLGAVILVGVWQIGSITWQWVKRRWL